MDPVSTALIAGATAGVAGGLTEASKKLIVDAYEALKTLLKNKFGEDNRPTKVAEDLEANTEADYLKAGIETEVKKVKADEDEAVLAAAQTLLDRFKEHHPQGAEHVQMIASGSYIAQASHGGTASVNVNQPKESQ